ncbi:hypothetical protein A3A64_02445 [Candidatus Gottesmanbacteria bacterium RIFCSPLOWO2_01_FULL_48_11]|uniref:Transposase IS200-like domain-containing protein n=2 Tax=Candidatus Gottesmaniibacteriota TaxID=1752720 RepID=A0A0G1X2L8_9BACT|nr:MAG: hypothetical protein UY16_C0003G0007 [Candidatus Gottesmanbacteria bacterium GW2011_GWA2_47_9]OGG28292.1 MAG: hypothetical protein A3A64_02445 [Candidatus Gottesmanbacteria bacterium RIFCSPLOWO2_01_FULL_48_11]
MSTPPRYLQIGIPYHVYNRGNRKNKIFLNVKDYQRFLRKLKEYTKKFDVSLVCYCLMPNHFHLLLVQKDESAITKFMLSLCTSYSKYFNIKHELVGRLFQARFRAKIVETDEYLLHLSRYIHLNSISDDLEDLTFLLNPPSSTPGVERSKIHKQLIDYPWSSYREYCEDNNGICDKNLILDYFSSTQQSNSYESFIESGISEKESEFITPFL